MINEVTDAILNVINSILWFFLDVMNFLIKNIGVSEILIIAGCVLIVFVWIFQDKISIKVNEMGWK